MDFKTYVSAVKSELADHLREKISERQHDVSSQMALPVDALSVLADFSTRGKMMRGVLFLLAVEAYGGSRRDMLDMACSLELMHSALLIHDDIMDNDELRRGKKTVFAHYKRIAQDRGHRDPHQYGVSLGIVIGDIALFMAEELAVSQSNTRLHEILRYYTQELRVVGIGQLFDYEYGAWGDEISIDEIKKMYLQKSARYSIVLPLVMGAISQGQQQREQQILAEFGEAVGMIFQIIDDEIGIFGTQQEIGKNVGSDIGENKKTWMRSVLFQRADPKTRTRLNALFGHPVNDSEIEEVRRVIIDTGVKKEMDRIVEEYRAIAHERLGQLAIPKKFHSVFRELVEYNVVRSA